MCGLPKRKRFIWHFAYILGFLERSGVVSVFSKEVGGRLEDLRPEKPARFNVIPAIPRKAAPAPRHDGTARSRNLTLLTGPDALLLVLKRLKRIMR